MTNKHPDKINKLISENIRYMLNEYADKNHIMPLYHYLSMNDDEKEKDLIYNGLDMFYDFIVDNYSDDFDEEELEELEEQSEYLDEELANNIINGKYSEYKEYFINYLRNYYDENYYNAPAYLFMDDVSLVKNKWLIHFSDNAYSIANNGFKYGTEDFNNIAYTGAGEIKNKYGEGYDFAYLVDDFERFYRGDHKNGTKYGDEAVIFMASGVRIWHYGDEEYQVIFYGPSAKNFIYIENNDEYGDWRIVSTKNGNALYYSEKLEDVVYWAINNYDQYQKVMMNPKGNRRNKKYETDYQ